jgi:predicted RNase H-like HicB family nuclease
MDKYPISIKWSDEDGGYIATIPGIRGLSAFGESSSAALSEMKIAADAYFQSLKNAGKRMPVLDKITPFSGQLRLRMPKSLHAELSQAAANEGISLNTYLLVLLSKKQSERDLLEKLRSAERAPSTVDKTLRSS